MITRLFVSYLAFLLFATLHTIAHNWFIACLWLILAAAAFTLDTITLKRQQQEDRLLEMYSEAKNI